LTDEVNACARAGGGRSAGHPLHAEELALFKPSARNWPIATRKKSIKELPGGGPTVAEAKIIFPPAIRQAEDDYQKFCSMMKTTIGAGQPGDD